ncbi:MAG: leucine-rich repeat protein, partial [Alloprevotella sp.]|nr:leucine-rich repeat protein [Alloprevotella sp.]
CSSLGDVDLPSSVLSIGGEAFQGCNSLHALNLPSSIKSIGGGAFLGCSNLRDIYVASSFPAKLKKNAFSKDTQRSGVLHVYPHSIDAYRLDKSWSKFANIVDYTRNEMETGR